MRRLLAATAAGLLLLGAAGCSGSHDNSTPGTSGTKTSATQVGDRLPDVTLPALRSDADAIDLGTLKGPAVLNLWANWCGPCREEMPLLERFHSQQRDVKVIGINALDTKPGLARQVADEAGVTYPLVVDEDQAIPAISLPRTLLIDRSGRITYSAYVQITSLDQIRDLVKQHLPGAEAAR